MSAFSSTLPHNKPFSTPTPADVEEVTILANAISISLQASISITLQAS